MTAAKWFRLLAGITIVSLVNSAANYLPFLPASLSTWISRGIMAVTVYCLFQLSSANIRYKKAAIFRAVILGCALITSFLFGSYLLSIVASIASFVAVYQEYAAHAELTAEADPVLSRKWHNLFFLEILAAILLSFGSTVAAVILMTSELQVDAARISGIVITLLNIPQIVLQVVRLLYLNKTISIFSSVGE